MAGGPHTHTHTPEPTPRLVHIFACLSGPEEEREVIFSVASEEEEEEEKEEEEEEEEEEEGKIDCPRRTWAYESSFSSPLFLTPPPKKS